MFEKSIPPQDYDADDSSYIDVIRQPNTGKSNEGLECKTKSVSDDGGNDIGEKGPAVGQGSQVNGKEQTKKENRGTSINDVNGSWASRVNTNDLPVELFLLFAQHKNASSEHLLTLPMTQG